MELGNLNANQVFRENVSHSFVCFVCVGELKNVGYLFKFLIINTYLLALTFLLRLYCSFFLLQRVRLLPLAVGCPVAGRFEYGRHLEVD